MEQWKQFILFFVIGVTAYIVTNTIRIIRLPPEDRKKRIAELKSKNNLSSADTMMKDTVSIQSQEAAICYDGIDHAVACHDDIDPVPWEQRTIHIDSLGVKYFVVWSGEGPLTEFTVKRKDRIKGIPYRLMKGFDGLMYISMRIDNDSNDKIYCYDDVSSQIKSVGHAPGKLLDWSRRVIGFDESTLDAIPFDNSIVNLALRCDFSKSDITATFTYRLGDDRQRLTVKSFRLYQHKITGEWLLGAYVNSLNAEKLLIASRIETMVITDDGKKLNVDDWIKWMCEIYNNSTV